MAFSVGWQLTRSAILPVIRIDGRPKLIGWPHEKDNKRDTDHVAVCHVSSRDFVVCFRGQKAKRRRHAMNDFARAGHEMRDIE
jgi:hypothetical protein